MYRDSLRTMSRAPTRTSTLAEVSWLNLNWSVAACWRDSESALRSLRDSSLCSAGSQTWVCDKTKMAGNGIVALPNRPAESVLTVKQASRRSREQQWKDELAPSDTARRRARAQRRWIQLRIRFKISMKRICFSRYFSRYFSCMNSNMISLIKSHNSSYLAWIHWKLWILVHEEKSWQRPLTSY